MAATGISKTQLVLLRGSLRLLVLCGPLYVVVRGPRRLGQRVPHLGRGAEPVEAAGRARAAGTGRERDLGGAGTDSCSTTPSAPAVAARAWRPP